MNDSVAEQCVRLVTMNTFGVPTQMTRVRLRTLARELNVAEIDVACFQEVQLSYFAWLMRREFHALPHAALKPHLYAPKGGLLTLSRWPVKHVEFHPFRQRGLRLGPSVADWALYKGALIVELETATPTIIVNTHLNANYDGDWSERNRYANIEHTQVQQLISLVANFDPAAMVMLAGDFNFPRGSWLYTELVSEAGLIDPQAVCQEPTYRPHRLLPPHYAQPIDFALVRPPKGVLIRTEARTLFGEHVTMVNGRRGYLSDHHAVQVDVTWPNLALAPPLRDEAEPL